MFWTYILRSAKTGKFYIGSTADLEKRIKRHNSGGSTYTKSCGPFELIFSEEYDSRAEAVMREKQIKGYKGGIQFKKLIEKIEKS